MTGKSRECNAAVLNVPQINLLLDISSFDFLVGKCLCHLKIRREKRNNNGEKCLQRDSEPRETSDRLRSGSTIDVITQERHAKTLFTDLYPKLSTGQWAYRILTK